MNTATPGFGTLYIVGLGPGTPGLLTPDAAAAIEAADTVVGYDGYLAQIGVRLAGKTVIGLDLGYEVERARVSLDAAESGATVALVSSGDAGVYGMGGVVWELAAERATPPEIILVPGVTAACSSAARLGAPIAHDWMCVSLSDLLTPWRAILERIDAAARADLVLVLYNPASRSRIWQLGAVAERLLRVRAPQTPVGLVENAYRPEETVEIIPLVQLPGTSVSMFTTVIIGNSRTFLSHGKMVTPRIYAAKTDPDRASTPANAAGETIMAESLALIERELGPTPADRAERSIVGRMIHATADFDFATSVRFGQELIARAVEAFRGGAAVVTDVEMLRVGVRRDLAEPLGVVALCAIDEPGTRALAARAGLTRSAAGIRRLAERVGDGVVAAVGNAPTALEEAIRLVDCEGWKPAGIVGIPVGFVGVEEAKRRLAEETTVPFLTSLGRKGGTAVTAAAVNALLALAREDS
jgi:precorrin-3B C17-methyltransferase